MIIYDSFDNIPYTKLFRQFKKKYPTSTGKGLPRFYECEDCLLEMDQPTVVTRREWEARIPRVKEKQQTKVPKVVITWTDSDYCDNQQECSTVLRKVQNKQLDDELLDDIRYNFMVGGDGKVYEGRGWRVRPQVKTKKKAVAKELDENSVYMAFIGPKDGIPTTEMVKAISYISTIGVTRQHIARNVTLVKADKDKLETKQCDAGEDKLNDEEDAALFI